MTLPRFSLPFRGAYGVTQGFGPTSYAAEPAYDGYAHFHDGLDYALPAGTPVLAVGTGTVIAAGWDTTGFGNRVEIAMGNGIDTLYGHLSSLGVAVGQAVTAGQQIGLSGSTGNSSGPHLHFSVLQGGVFVDPLPYLTGGSPPPAAAGGNWWDGITGIPGDIGHAVGHGVGAVTGTATSAAAAAGQAAGSTILSGIGTAASGLFANAGLGAFLRKWGVIVLLSVAVVALVLELFHVSVGGSSGGGAGSAAESGASEAELAAA